MGVAVDVELDDQCGVEALVLEGHVVASAHGAVIDGDHAPAVGGKGGDEVGLDRAGAVDVIEEDLVLVGPGGVVGDHVEVDHAEDVVAGVRGGVGG